MAAWWPSSCIHQLSCWVWKLPRCVAETANSTRASTHSARRAWACARVSSPSGTISSVKQAVSSWKASVEVVVLPVTMVAPWSTAASPAMAYASPTTERPPPRSRATEWTTTAARNPSAGNETADSGMLSDSSPRRGRP